MSQLEHLSRNIKLLRNKKKISQEALAHTAGLKLSNLSKLEGGFSLNPTLSTLQALAKVLTSGSIDKLLKPQGVKNK
jgi:transcriptional regulator with XRE-family HTH domain